MCDIRALVYSASSTPLTLQVQKRDLSDCVELREKEEEEEKIKKVRGGTLNYPATTVAS